MSIYFKPTWLYVKRHKITGLQYFGKTVSKDPYKYQGSGTFWIRHISKHGKEHIETVWVQLFDNRDELIAFANIFSKMFNIVESKDWANLCIENGTDGGYRHNNHLKILNSRPKSKKVCKAISVGLQGNKCRAKKVLIDDITFESMRAAGKHYNVSEQVIYRWVKIGKAIKI